ncbi:putative membrane-bound protein [Roseovarius mucosus DSM 17069]|uniref:Putative membrane-bound protein n=1 Tax=Roseovarius mucosus DSM 17069 TaxID=1288298 RepID=A0A0A0HSF8_9RHOB|nr:heme biosynthesis HemY N-terminal domain-containing protein [Roseovarius mucosus]KGM89549.1 putative membrane-bound protein [Roseovarius mucosus DSM 17069]
MLWSIIKIAVFIALVAGVTLGASFLLELDGGVRIVMAGVEINLTPIKAVIALGVLVFAIWLLMKLTGLVVASLRFINGDETALSRYFDRSRQDKGYRALSEGMLALASGEGDVAMAQAAKAEKYLRKPALTNLITAQAAEMAGNGRKAEEVYKQLLTNEKTRFVGVRGILRQKLAQGDTETALKLAKTAFALKPRHGEVQDTLLELQAKTADWKGARATLNAKLKYGSLPRDVHKRRDAVLALSEARDVLDEGKTIEAREAAIEANRLSPDLIPAAVLAARGYLDQGNTRNALRVINKAWLVHPHPDLAAAFAAIEPNESPRQRLKRFAKLLKVHPDNRETRLLEAELNLAAEDFPAARRALGTLAEVEPDARALTIMAAIERGEGAPDAVVKGWLARALSAPRGPQWVCDKCQHIHAEWAPACENCNSFDTLSWRAPPNSPIATPTGLEMLPLIVGALDEPKPEPEHDDQDTVPDAEIVEEEASAKGEK